MSSPKASALRDAVERLQQNLYICASTLAQHAALAGFEPQTLAECERRRGEFQRRRDAVVGGLQRIGLPVPVEPDGAFYAWADATATGLGSWDLCHHLLHRAQVALTPGRDFGPAAAERYLRLSFASSMNEIAEALLRIDAVLQAGLLPAVPSGVGRDMHHPDFERASAEPAPSGP